MSNQSDVSNKSDMNCISDRSVHIKQHVHDQNYVSDVHDQVMCMRDQNSKVNIVNIRCELCK